jgi:hypothetical protein
MRSIANIPDIFWLYCQYLATLWFNTLDLESMYIINNLHDVTIANISDVLVWCNFIWVFATVRDALFCSATSPKMVMLHSHSLTQFSFNLTFVAPSSCTTIRWFLQVCILYLVLYLSGRGFGCTRSSLNPKFSEFFKYLFQSM